MGGPNGQVKGRSEICIGLLQSSFTIQYKAVGQTSKAENYPECFLLFCLFAFQKKEMGVFWSTSRSCSRRQYASGWVCLLAWLRSEPDTLTEISTVLSKTVSTTLRVVTCGFSCTMKAVFCGFCVILRTVVCRFYCSML